MRTFQGSYRLRADLVIEPAADDAFQLVDPITGRRFSLDEQQADLLRLLDGEATVAQIAAELFGDPSLEDDVGRFMGKLRELGLLEESLDARTLGARQAEALQDAARAKYDARIRETVRWAAASIPFYRERLAGRAQHIHRAADLPHLPTMTKRDVRENFPGRLLPDGMSAADLLARGEVSLYSTSGTTGDRLQTFYDAKRNAYPESFPGIEPVPGRWEGARIALFTTPICSGLVCHMGGSSYEDRLAHEGAYLSLNSSDRVLALTRPELEDILEDMERFKPTIVRADPVYAVALARALQRERLPFPKFDVLWTAYEYCSVIHRPVLEASFGVPVFTVYAATDLGGGCQAFRCAAGRYHVRHNQYVFEFLEDQQPVAPGQIGEITVTSHYHRFIPMIRYRVEDLGRPIEEPCTCAHRDWPSFELEGRVKDCMRDLDGRLVTTRAFDDLFLGLTWLDFYQATQTAADQYEVLGVRREDTDESDAAIFVERARELLGAAASVRLRYVRQIPTEQSFKYRLTGSRIS